MRRKAQKNWNPIIPAYHVLPKSKRFQKRLTRVIAKELAAPLAPKPKHTMTEPKETLQDKLIRLGWQDSKGRSLDWTFWNRAPKQFHYEPD